MTDVITPQQELINQVEAARQAGEQMVNGRAGWDRSEYGDGQFDMGVFAANANGERWDAWHSLGEHFPEHIMSIDQAMDMVPLLDSEVLLRPIEAIVADTDDSIDVATTDEFLATVRAADNKILGVVGPNYRVLQNRRAFTFADELLGGGASIISLCGLRGGRQVTMSLKMPTGIQVAGLPTEELDVFLNLNNTHDGTSRWTCSIDPIRRVCTNTTRLGLKMAPRVWGVSHTASMDGRIAEARHALDMTTAYMRAFQEQAERMVAKKVSAKAFGEFLNQLIPLPVGDEATDRKVDNRETAIAAITGVYKGAADLDDIRGTAWGAYNAVCEYQDWHRPVGTSSTGRSQLELLIARQRGEGEIKSRAAELLLA